MALEFGMLTFSRNTVRSELTGGLGNQIFAFAAGLAISESRQSKLILDCGSIDYTHAGPGVDIRSFLSLEEYEFRRFPNLPPILRRLRDSLLFRLPFLKRFYYRIFGIVNETDIGAGQKIFDFLKPYREQNGDGGLHLKGYFQDLEIVEEVRESLIRRVRESYSTGGIHLLNSSENKDVLGIHVRGGDFLNPNWKLLVGNLSRDFYSRAIAEVVARGFHFDVVWVFTNDPHYARSILGDIDLEFCFVDESIIRSPAESFNLMRRCKGLITANSTYSYLAAFLSNDLKLVIIPKHFSKAGNQINGVPDHWVKIDSLWQ
jgi:hypothetical protein